jgi:hypothetical protein
VTSFRDGLDNRAQVIRVFCLQQRPRRRRHLARVVVAKGRKQQLVGHGLAAQHQPVEVRQ